MPSSTSSSRAPSTSRDRQPQIRWGRFWWLSLTVAVIVSASVEAAWRFAGARPWVVNGTDLWDRTYSDLDPEAVAILGTSRSQTGLDPDRLEAGWKRPVALLALQGASPAPIMEDLSRREDFRGVLLLELLPRLHFQDPPTQERLSRAFLKARQTSDWSQPSRWLESHLSTPLGERLVVRHPALSWKQHLRYLKLGTGSPARVVENRRNRHIRMHFDHMDAAAREKELAQWHRIQGRAAEGDALTERFEAILRARERLRSRGGDLIVFVMPRSRSIATIEETRFPFTEYVAPLRDRFELDLIAPATEPRLQGWECPDGSHLDSGDVDAFTDTFADVLRPFLD